MLALALALAAPLTDDQAKVLAAEQDISIRKVVAMDEEIDALKKNHAALAASRSLMEDEIRSIRARFPEVPIASGATIDQATAAFVAERARFGAIEAAKSQLLLDYSTQKMCVMIGETRRQFDDVYTAPRWVTTPLDKRMAIREAVEAVIQKLIGDDPDTRAALQARCPNMLTLPKD